ncbi:cell division protein ZapE [Anaplasma capra]|uniref:cell division protein ZapE n=1 Tax=Anaplasma capra TaxID=1562740 RepID=UPI0021D56A6C|nr:cell division protein ZapE [Anaplasma capra]MCU7611900.1 cell division protein ZapE [Anaplasma capra]MCU7612759.1 cell division protein ZapE [Anaplasma capra]
MLARYYGMVEAREIVFDALQVSTLKELISYDRTPPKWWEFWRKPGSTTKRGAYMHGDVGRGKSLLASLFYECSVIKKKKKIHFNTLIKDAHDLLHQKRIEDIQQSGHCISLIMDDMLRDVELLFLDEIQVHDICDAMILHKIFSVLFSKNLVVIMTSNYPPHGLYEGGLHRELFLPAISLLEQNMQVLEVSGQHDYRTIRGRNVRRYYVGDGSDHALYGHFLKLVGSRKVENTVLTVGAREIKVEKTCGSMAWFSFDDLCGSANPLWVADYKKIAESFSTIFISGIPVFDFYSQNEMQRFIILVDELYEGRVRIFCSLAADIGELHVGTPPMSFRRAASRLAEMGSELW